MIYPTISVSQEDPRILVIKDTTPDYSSLYKGGYGGINIGRDLIRKSLVTIKMLGVEFEIEQDFDVSTYETRIDSRFIQQSNLNIPTETTCKDCESHNGFHLKDGLLDSWPSGCLEVEYRVLYADENTGGLSCSNSTKANLILYYEVESEMIRIFENFPFPEDGTTGFSSESKRLETIGNLALAWGKIHNLEHFQSCSCDCVSSIIDSTRIYLNKIKDAIN